MIEAKALEDQVGLLLSVLYAKRFASLEKLRLKRLLDKNPYLYRALGIEDSLELLRQLLIAFVSSSDETLFGNDFFEPLALWAAGESSGHSGGQRVVTVGGAAGIDISYILHVDDSDGAKLFGEFQPVGGGPYGDHLRGSSLFGYCDGG